MSPDIHSLRQPPDWSTPENQTLQEKMIRQFEATLPRLLLKINAILPFVETNNNQGTHPLGGRIPTRSRVVSTAYARLWGLESSISSWFFVVSDGDTARMELDKIPPEDIVSLEETSLHLEAKLLSDTGVVSYEANFNRGARLLSKRLAEKRKSHPGAKVLGMRSCAVAGSGDFLHVSGWNMDAVDAYLRQLVEELDPLQVGLMAPETEPFS